ncbi:hypothetical protein DBV05_g12484, partial [Lasiodiplodia theobromae]
MHDQSQSPFFKLPAELRRAIYSEAGLGNATIHCFTREFENQTGADTCPVERLTKKTSTNIYHGKVCTHPQNGSSSAAPYSSDAPNHCSGCATASRQALTCLPASFIDVDHLRGSTSLPSSCIVPLLQTCRRLYTEAIATLYAETTFSFTDLFTLTDFLTSAIPRAHAARIRSLALTWTPLTQPIVPRSSLSPGMVHELRRRHGPRGCPLLLRPPYAAPPAHLVGPPHDAATWRDEVCGVVRALLPGLRRLRLELADRVDDGCGSEGVGQLRHAHEVWCGRGTPSYARPEELWVEWLRPVGEALEGREEEVAVEGGIWCLAINAPIHCFTHRMIDEDLPPRVYGKVCTLPQDGSIAYWDPDVEKYCRPCKMKADQLLHNYPEAFTEFQPAGVSPSVVPLMQTCRIL